jgi:hypothetical protein
MAYPRMDSDEFYLAIDIMGGYPIYNAVKKYSKIFESSVDPNSYYSIKCGVYRYYNHHSRIREIVDNCGIQYVRDRLRKAMKSEEVVVESKPIEPVVTPEVVTPSPSIEVGDIVIANWNIADTPGLNGAVVKILVFEGDQVCVKDPGGTISVFNVKNLRPIPKDF